MRNSHSPLDISSTNSKKHKSRLSLTPHEKENMPYSHTPTLSQNSSLNSYQPHSTSILHDKLLRDQ